MRLCYSQSSTAIAGDSALTIRFIHDDRSIQLLFCVYLFVVVYMSVVELNQTKPTNLPAIVVHDEVGEKKEFKIETEISMNCLDNNSYIFIFNMRSEV